MDKKHTHRIAAMLAIAVIALVALSVDQFMNSTTDQQAAVLNVVPYGR